MSTLHLELPADLLDAAHLSEDELRLEIAIHLFEQGRLSFGKARELASVDGLRFQQILGNRGIAVHYGITEYEQDLVSISKLLSQ